MRKSEVQKHEERCWVRTDRGQVLIQVLEGTGCYLTDGDQSWDGGHGIAASWELISESEVPLEVVAEMGWVLEA